MRQLLPYAYVYPDGHAKRFVRFSGRYYDDVVSGRKIRTVRYLDPVPLGATTFVFEDPDLHGFRTLNAVVENCVPILLSDLDFDYQANLRQHYPLMPETAQLEDVRFHI